MQKKKILQFQLMMMISLLNSFDHANFTQKVPLKKYISHNKSYTARHLETIFSQFQIKNYYKFRVKHKKIYEDLSPQSLKHVFDHDILHLQPQRDQFGRRIIILEIGSMFIFSILFHEFI